MIDNQKLQTDKNILSDGWQILENGYYFSSGKKKEIEGVICYVRRTALADFLRKYANTKVKNTDKISLFMTGANDFPSIQKNASNDLICYVRGPIFADFSKKSADDDLKKVIKNNTFYTGANPPMGTPKGLFAPVGYDDTGIVTLPPLSNFDMFQSMVDARSDKDTLLLGFDSEWDGNITLSWQFACIQDFDLIEFLYVSTSKENLTLDYCIGRLCDYLKLTTVDKRSITRYSYCTEFKNGHPVVSTTDSVNEARNRSVYLYRDKAFQQEKIHEQPDRFLKRSERDWAWFHLWHDYQSCNKIPITLVCHTGRVDVRNFDSDQGKYIFQYCSNIQGGLVTLNYPIMCYPKSVMIDNNNHGAYIYPISLSIRDTMCHAPSGMKSLEALGNVVGIDKINLSDDIKSHMADLLKNDPALFLRYASRDSVVTMLYASALYGYNKEMPLTLTSAAAKVARKVMMSYLNCKTTEEFNMIYRGLKKVSHGMMPRTDRPGYIESSSFEPISDKANSIQYYCSQAFHGGYNSSSLIGYFPGHITYDYDLQNAYPTSNSLVPDVNWADPIINELINRKLTLTDFILNQFTGQINPLPLFVCYGTFKFPDDVKYPCIPVTVDGIPIYPKSSEGLNGIYMMGPEVVLALHLGAEVNCERGFFIRPLLRSDNSVSYSLRAANHQLVSDRSKAKKILGKNCLEEQALKTMDNSIYGKNAQNVVNKSTWSAYTKEMEDLGASSITNPVSAAMTTSIVRAALLAVQNQVESSGYHCYSVTTDGGLFDCPEDVMKSFDLYGIKYFLSQSRLFLTDGSDPEIWEIKHAQDDLLNFCRRGNTSRYTIEHPFIAPNGKKYAGVNAHNSTKSGFESDSAEDREWLYNQVMTRKGAVRYFVDEWTGFKEQAQGERFEVKKNIPKDVRMDFDLSRKPDRDSFYPVYAEIYGQPYEMACFDTLPFDDISEFRKYRDKKKLTKVLRTMADWDVFWHKMDLNSCSAKPRDVDFSIIMSIIMGYRSGKYQIPKLDECMTVSEKINYINKHNTSKKVFTLNNWKDARKPSRQSNMLPDEFLIDKLYEFINDIEVV